MLIFFKQLFWMAITIATYVFLGYNIGYSRGFNRAIRDEEIARWYKK